MAKTVVSDVIVPEVFEKYVIERTAELPKFAQSGIINNDPTFSALAAGPGTVANMPFWQDISGGRQLIKDDTSLTTVKIGATSDIAAIHNDANAWSTTLLAGMLAGSDPMKAIGELVAAYWAREDETLLVACINGLYLSLDAESGDPNILKIASESIAATTADTQLTGTTFIDALQVLGDMSSRLTAIAIHSATEAQLKKADLIDYVPDSEGKAQIATFQGRRVVVDDDLATRAGTTDGLVYKSVLFGSGAFGAGSASLSGEPLDGGFGTEGVEFARVPLDHDSILINRRRHILHPRGIKWTSSSVVAQSPTNVECALAANWDIVFESKNVRIVIIEHNLDQ